MQKENQEGGASQSRADNSSAAGTGGSGGAAGGRGRGNAANLSHEARVKGGQRSAQVQVRDEHGQFAGRSDKGRSRNQAGTSQPRGDQQENRKDSGSDDDSTPGR